MLKKNKLKIFIKKKYYYNNLCKNIEFINIETNFINWKFIYLLIIIHFNV